MRNKIILFITFVLAIASIICAFSFTVSAEENTVPTVAIEKFNLVFDDNVYLKYAVKFEGVEDSSISSSNIGMLFFTEARSDYTAGGETYSSAVTGYTTISNVKYYTFEYRHITAKNMTDYIYSVAYIDVDGTRYYSEGVKFSVLDYAYSKLGLTGTASENENFKAMLSSMLEYGANAQKYFSYREDRPANASYYLVEVIGGSLEDEFTHGLYHAGETAILTANATEDGFVFAGWQNSAGEIVSTDNPAELTNFSANDTYTAVYEMMYSSGLLYTLSSDETYYIVSGIGTCTDTHIIIPDSYQGLPVKEIGENSFKNVTQITAVTIPEKITSIGNSAFYDCTNIEEIHFNAVEMNNLKSGNHVFVNAGKDGGGITVTIGNNVTKIPSYLFYPVYQQSTYAPMITSVEFEENSSCNSIENFAFAYAPYLSSISIPEGITSIGSYAFSNCSNLTEAIIPTSITSIDYYSFSSCENLVYNEYENAYYLGNSLNPFLVLVKAINTDIINCNIYNKTKIICHSAFWNCSKLESIIIPENIEKIENTTFCNCTNLSSVIIANSVKSIGSSAFSNCTNLTTVNIPDSVASIGENSFKNCTNLRSITIGNSITAIGKSAFANCTLVEEIYFNAVAMNDFNQYSYDIFTNIGNDSAGINVFIDNCVTKIPARLFYESSNIISVEFEQESVCKSIGSHAFYNCTKLANITIPDSVTSINDYSFYGCSALKNLTIGKNVASIGSEAFRNCTALETIYFNANVMNGISSDKRVFDSAGNNSKGITVVVGNNVTTIPMGLFNGYYYSSPAKIITVVFEEASMCESIGSHAFRKCESLNSIIIPNDITSIEQYAFNDCSNLIIVYYYGTAENWSNIEIGSSNDPLTNATLYYFSETQPTLEGNYWYRDEDGNPVAW